MLPSTTVTHCRLVYILFKVPPPTTNKCVQNIYHYSEDMHITVTLQLKCFPAADYTADLGKH